jgi:hypothetical protein
VTRVRLRLLIAVGVVALLALALLGVVFSALRLNERTI